MADNNQPAGISEEKINRINELVRKKKTIGLTEEELKEQKELYAEFLSNIRKQVEVQLYAAGFTKKPKN
ncbi:protein of unknown function [Thermosyntropha lipolytica DSM 11003]|uniref:UPF0291 protein SAMN02745221_02110 n=1 Tax=Thermosyntropha lipolytica DSM 11003 TaxID=1123382 RepID=A0A1M5RUB1_9FIRM|nr:DUF896 domain-containing protein [Thermosyntropha lipolytica]SHH29816.1 protein of unknown function [Thermosyntropha lipolytica DSM 11003]